ncbi:hypothetical protein F0562_017038 [Nyssa sinensis]|uniref:Uncharacterized protein n=1 Tax=Nyssa sinensis TaxID=561372 RepID=A0A5J4ZG04_9ASTE|nr:hypothetical protein F0562_017038 [Nyssa sinensis]
MEGIPNSDCELEGIPNSGIRKNEFGLRTGGDLSCAGKNWLANEFGLRTGGDLSQGRMNSGIRKNGNSAERNRVANWRGFRIREFGRTNSGCFVVRRKELAGWPQGRTNSEIRQNQNRVANWFGLRTGGDSEFYRREERIRKFGRTKSGCELEGIPNSGIRKNEFGLLCRPQERIGWLAAGKNEFGNSAERNRGANWFGLRLEERIRVALSCAGKNWLAGRREEFVFVVHREELAGWPQGRTNLEIRLGSRTGSGLAGWPQGRICHREERIWKFGSGRELEGIPNSVAGKNEFENSALAGRTKSGCELVPNSVAGKNEFRNSALAGRTKSGCELVRTRGLVRTGGDSEFGN